MSATVSDFDQLVSMGFPPEKVERALKATGGLQTAMDWLLAHPGDLDAPAGGQSLGGRPNLETGAPASGPEGKAVEEDEGEIVDGEQTAKSLQCNDCQKLFRDSSAAERHAARSGHVNFSESTTAIKPLTPEEKAAKLAEIKQRLAEKREQRLLTEEEEARNREKIRRKSGKELIDIKEKLETREMEKALTLKKKEKDEEKKAKAKIKAQIEADKRERIAKREATKQAHLEQQAAEAASTSTSEVKKEYTETRLQIRQMSGGAPLTHTFQASDTLKTVYEYVGQHIDGAFKLMITFPRKVLERDSFDDKTLKELDLVPSGILMVTL